MLILLKKMRQNYYAKSRRDGISGEIIRIIP